MHGSRSRLYLIENDDDDDNNNNDDDDDDDKDDFFLAMKSFTNGYILRINYHVYDRNKLHIL